MNNKVVQYINLNGLKQREGSVGNRYMMKYTIMHDDVPIYGKSIVDLIKEKRRRNL